VAGRKNPGPQWSKFEGSFCYDAAQIDQDSCSHPSTYGQYSPSVPRCRKRTRDTARCFGGRGRGHGGSPLLLRSPRR